MRPLACTLALAILLIAGHAHAQRAEYRLGSKPHANVPFTLDVVIEGFDETPPPVQPKLEIPGAVVTPLGASPNVSQSIQIIGGRRSISTRVTWVLRYRVETARAGRLQIPALQVAQGAKTAKAAAGDLEVDTVPLTGDMKLALELPQRPIYVGETVPVTLSWTFRRQPQDQVFAVPLMSLPDFTISATPVTDPRQMLTFSAGAKDLPLQYTVEKVTDGGVEANRVTVTFFAAPRKVGKVAVPASSVVAALAVGRADFFGNAPTKLYRAVDVPRTLEVRPLPETNRPASFSGAVGEQFSIAVRTSRSVVSLGEPVELAITVKSNQRLDTLVLPKLDGEGGLPKDKFTVPAEPPIGTLGEDGKSKAFQVVAQVSGPATEIPALAFSYFDPTKGEYRTIYSDPIAISVKGGSVVGASDVVLSRPAKPGAPAADDATTTLVDADLALSAGTGRSPLDGAMLWLLVGLLYALPLGFLAFRTWQVRTRGQREEAAEVKTARRRVEELLDRAATAPAREVAGPLAAALRDLAKALDRPVDDGGLLAKLETESFAPEASGRPLSNDLRSHAAGVLRRWLGDRRRGTRATAAVSLLAIVLLAPTAHADALADGRAAYQDAMSVQDPTARRTAFGRAAALLGEAARESRSADLLADWGNAALGGGDMATATLAYRRALAIDGSHPRARKNLAWLRTRQPALFQPTTATGATDTLLFFHHWPRGRRLLVGAVAFAIAVLLLVPWSGRRSRALTGLATLPLAIWIAMLVSVLVEDRREHDAIVMEGVVMRAADAPGAPAALSQPLPRGAEVVVLEQRASWTRIQVANGTAGWVPTGSVQHVAR